MTLNTTNLGALSPLPKSGKSLRIPIERTRKGKARYARSIFFRSARLAPASLSCQTLGIPMTRIIFLVVLLVFGMPVIGAESPASGPQGPSVEDAAQQQMLEEGIKLVSGKRPAEAIEKYFSKVVAFYEEHAQAGVAIYSARWLPETLLYLAEAANRKQGARVVSRNYSYAYFLEAYAFSELNRMSEASSAIDQAIRLAPHNSQFLSEKGNQLTKAKDWDDSLAIYKRAEVDAREFSPPASKNIEIARALRGQGYALVELHRLSEAEGAYLKCLEIDPSDRAAQAELGYVRSKSTGTRQ